MRDLLPEYERLRVDGPVGRAVVTGVWGSAPRPEGAVLLATPSGRMAGSVSGGCVEAATVDAIGEAMRSGAPRLVTWTVTHERAWEVGLACGGTIHVFIEPSVRPEILAAAKATHGSAVATVLSGPDAGVALTVTETGDVVRHGMSDALADAVVPPARVALAALASRTVDLTTEAGSVSVLLEVFPRSPTLLVIGAVHIAESLVPMANLLGFRTVVADGRAAFLTKERFPDADELVLAWPEAAFAQVGVNAATCICVLSHDPKFDEPALELALRSPAIYVGAIGSRKTQAGRRERLAAAGFTDAEIARLRGPIGLDLGGREPAETALAILAEITAARHGRSGGSLTNRSAPG